MTVVIGGTGAALDFRNVDIGNWYYSLTLTARNSTYSAGDYRLNGQSSYVTEFFGSGFTYDASGLPNGGIVNSFRESNFGAQLFRVEGLNVSVNQLLTWSANRQTETAFVTLLAGSDSITGSPLNDFVRGYGGDDSFSMGNGDDTVYGGAGNDIIDGGPGVDTVWLTGRASDYTLVTWNGQVGAAPRNGTAFAAEGIDRMLVSRRCVLHSRLSRCRLEPPTSLHSTTSRHMPT
jgi:Ca2+-binding RTX toxin-like protein